MENLTTLEQPLDTAPEVNANKLIVKEEEDNTSAAVSSSSTYGKFKDATSLLNAYENLEKEFTRKSQKLAELLKVQETNSAEQIKQEAYVQDYENQNNTTNSQNTEFIYKQKNWHTEVNNFFQEVPEAKQYSKQISELLIKDKALAQSKDCLKYAYATIVSEQKVAPANPLDDPNYFESLVNDNKLKEKIISNYLLNLQTGKNNLHIISGEANTISPTQPPDKPKNLKEASTILKRLLES